MLSIGVLNIMGIDFTLHGVFVTNIRFRLFNLITLKNLVTFIGVFFYLSNKILKSTT